MRNQNYCASFVVDKTKPVGWSMYVEKILAARPVRHRAVTALKLALQGELNQSPAFQKDAYWYVVCIVEDYVTETGHIALIEQWHMEEIDRSRYHEIVGKIH